MAIVEDDVDVLYKRYRYKRGRRHCISSHATEWSSVQSCVQVLATRWTHGEAKEMAQKKGSLCASWTHASRHAMPCLPGHQYLSTISVATNLHAAHHQPIHDLAASPCLPTQSISMVHPSWIIHGGSINYWAGHRDPSFLSRLQIDRNLASCSLPSRLPSAAPQSVCLDHCYHWIWPTRPSPVTGTWSSSVPSWIEFLLILKIQ
jgi:hypothetical protein